MTNKELYSYLSHHGIKGQKWGVRRYQNEDGSLTSKGKLKLKYKDFNINTWGKSKDTNVMYIGGYSGSGKSTLANHLKDDKTNVINLDLYFENYNNPQKTDKEFDKFLKKNNIKPPKSKDADYDAFENALEKFGDQQYKKNKKVIVEGIQIIDEGVRIDKTYFKSKPFILMKTSPIQSIIRARERDGMKGLSIDDIKRYIKTYSFMNKSMKDIENIFK